MMELAATMRQDLNNKNRNRCIVVEEDAHPQHEMAPTGTDASNPIEVEERRGSRLKRKGLHGGETVDLTHDDDAREEDGVVIMYEKAQLPETRMKERKKKKRRTIVVDEEDDDQARDEVPHYTYIDDDEDDEEAQETDEQREERELTDGAGLFYSGWLGDGGENTGANGEKDGSTFKRGKRDQATNGDESLSLTDLEEAVMAHSTRGDTTDGIVWRDCAICLSRPSYRDGAVIEGCYHSFCFVCIAHWAAVNPACPLCKRKFDTVLHDLRLMPGPAARIHFRRWRVGSESDVPAAAISRSQGNATAQRRRDNHNVAIGILQASGRKGASLAGESELDRRRCIYSLRLRALPPPAIASMMAKDRVSLQMAIARRMPDVTREWDAKLKPWVVRELQAVLEDNDVDLLALMVRTLLITFASQTSSLRPRPSASSKGGTGQAALKPEIANAAWNRLTQGLEDFLVDDAATFVHELLCYAVSTSRDVTSYDATVRYPTTNDGRGEQEESDQRSG